MRAQSKRAGRPRKLLALATLLLGACGGEPPEQLPPNLLFISIDTLRADALGSYGSDWGASPFLDRFAEQGLRFESAWAHTPKTAPSHMTMFTGLPPRAHGVGNQRSSGNQSLSEKVTTLAEVLEAAGYRRGAVTSGGNVKGYLGFERGFEIYDERPKDIERKLASSREWIASVRGAQAAERPWFFFFHTYAVHDPYLPPKKFRKRYSDPTYAGKIVGDPLALQNAIREGQDLAPWATSHQKVAENFWARVDQADPADMAELERLYMAGLAGVDHQLRLFLEDLQKSGALANTIVVITSDHGEEFGEHGSTRHDQLWQEHLRVPLLVDLPPEHAQDAAARGRTIAGAVRHMDLMPSLLDLMGLEADELVGHAMLGESWAPWLADAELEHDQRPVLGEHRSKLEQPLDIWSLRFGDQLLIQPTPAGQLLHVDRSRNPNELLGEDGATSGVDPQADPTAAELLDLKLRELGRFQRAAIEIGEGPGIQLTDAARAELEALGYL